MLVVEGLEGQVSFRLSRVGVKVKKREMLSISESIMVSFYRVDRSICCWMGRSVERFEVLLPVILDSPHVILHLALQNNYR